MKAVLREFISRVIGLFGRRRSDTGLTDEIRTHLDLLTEAHVRVGMPLEAARAAARPDFGGVEQMKDQYREQRGLQFLETLHQDLRYEWRLLYRSPSFTIAAMLILALGIGATTGIFSLVDVALIRPLPFRDPDRLVMLWERMPRFARNRVSPLTFLDWNEQNRTFASMAAVTSSSATLTDAGGAPESIPSQNVTAGFFDVLGVAPIARRTFVEDDFSVKVAAVGLLIGVAASLALVCSMESLLFAVTPFDPMTFAGASALLALVALAACALPAIRAARSDPAVALRQE